jgi:elongation factor G
VLDGAVAVFDGKEGVEAQSETVWRQADRYRVPRLCFVNKMDKLGANFDFSFATRSRRAWAPTPSPIQIPDRPGHDLRGIIDLVKMKAYYFDLDQGEIVKERRSPKTWMDIAKKWRHDMIEKAAELDDHLMEKYLNDEQPITEEEIKAALRKGTIARACYPVLCGAALKQHRRAGLLDAVVDYLPNPTEKPEVEGTDPRDKEKKMTRPHDRDGAVLGPGLQGRLRHPRRPDLHARLLRHAEQGRPPAQPRQRQEVRTPAASSRCTPRTASRSTRSGRQHRRGRRHQGLLHGRHALRSGQAHHPRAHDTSPSPSSRCRSSPRPPTTSASCRRPRHHPSRGPLVPLTYDEETGQTIISGMGELHLEIIRRQARPRHEDQRRGRQAPRLVPRGHHRHRQVTSAASSSQADRRSRPVRRLHHQPQPYTAEQAEADELDFTDNVAFENKIVGGSIPKEFIPSVEYGVRQTASGRARSATR